MITAVTGRTGEGKSCYAVRFLIIPALLYTARPVVTNISLDLEELEKYIVRKGGEFDRRQLICLPNAHESVEVTFEVDGEEILFAPKEFWKCCPKDSIIVFDEAAEYLNSFDLSRNEQAKTLGSYGRLHRHMGHEVFFLLQEFTHMAKQMRDLVQKHITLYSLYQHPLGGILKIKAFIIRHYDIGGTKSTKAEKMEVRRYSNDIFKLYDSHQHADYHESLEYAALDKTTLKKGKLGAIWDRMKSNPKTYIILIAICFVTYGITQYFSVKEDFFEPANTNTNTYENDETTAKKDSNIDDLNPLIKPLSRIAERNRYRDTTSFTRASNTYEAVKARGYKKRDTGKKGDTKRGR